jgi:hypothetical protein
MDVSSLAGRVMSSSILSTRIHPVTGWPWLLPPSQPVPPTACLTVSLPKGRRHGVTTFHVSDSDYVPPTACLTVSLPKGRRHGVTTFHVSDSDYLRSTLSAGGDAARVGRSLTHPNHPLTILVQAYQLLWLVNVHGSYKCSLPLTLVAYPNPSPGWSFQERFRLTASTPFAQANFGALSGRLHTRQGCTLSACFHRIAATGRWVQKEA